MINKGRVVLVGEVLFDIFPGYRRLGGAPLNVAFHLHHLTHSVKFISRVGRDDEGNEISRFLMNNGIDTSFIQVDNNRPTGRAIIEFSKSGEPEFAIHKDTAYDNLEFDTSVRSLLKEKTDVLYFGSLIQRTQSGFIFLKKVFDALSPDTTMFYDINLRPGCFEVHKIKDSLIAADVVKMNLNELKLLSEMMNLKMELQDFENYLLHHYGIQMLCITMGADGSRIVTEDRVVEKKEISEKVEDTVGAGDAYSAMIINGLLNLKELDVIANEASVFSSYLCSIKGALPEDEGVYREFQKGVKL